MKLNILSKHLRSIQLKNLNLRQLQLRVQSTAAGGRTGGIKTTVERAS